MGEAALRTIIPLTPAGIETEGDEIFKLTTKDGAMAVEKETVEKAKPAEFAPDMIFEQEPSQLLNALLPLYLNGQLLRVLQESVASELASRMQAMQSATDNAKDLQGRLETEMNRARQAKITQELMEIIAGADATNTRSCRGASPWRGRVLFRVRVGLGLGGRVEGCPRVDRIGRETEGRLLSVECLEVHVQ